MLYSVSMSTYDALRLLNLVVMHSDTLPQEDLDLVISSLHSDNKDIAVAAGLLLAELSKDQVLVFLKTFHELPETNQQLLVVFLSFCRYVECFSFLFTLFETTPNGLLKDILFLSLSETPYFTPPLILSRLDAASPSTLENYRLLMQNMGIKKFETYLALLPSLPFESFLRDTFGDSAIDTIKY